MRSTYIEQRLGEPEDSDKGQSSVLRPNDPGMPSKSGTPDFVPVGKDCFDSFKRVMTEHNDPGGLGDSKEPFCRLIRSNTIEIMQTLPLQKSSLFGESPINDTLPTGMNGEILNDKHRRTGPHCRTIIEEVSPVDDEDGSSRRVIGLESEKTLKSLHDRILNNKASKLHKDSKDLAGKPAKSLEFNNPPVEINQLELVRTSKKPCKESQLEVLVKVCEAKEVASGIDEEGFTTPAKPLSGEWPTEKGE